MIPRCIGGFNVHFTMWESLQVTGPRRAPSRTTGSAVVLRVRVHIQYILWP